MERILQNPLDIWKEGAQRIGENLMENLVDAVLANQDKGISQLQELQKWNFVKLVQKVMTTKLFPREAPNVSLQDSPLLNHLTAKTLSDDFVPHALGSVSIKLKSVEGLIFQAWRNDGHKLAKSLMWKVVVRLGTETLESAHIPMSGGLSEGSGEHEASHLDWRDESLKFPNVYDLQADVVIELHRKRMSGDIGDDLIPDTAVTDLQAFFGGKDKSLEQVEREGANREYSLIDAMALKNQAVGVWQLYGRVVVPLTSLLNSPMTRASDEGATARSLCGWFHLYPASQQESEYKYTKPWSGYPGVGMINPRISLGFFHLAVSLQPRYSLTTTILANLVNPPQKVWVQATKLDLQVFEAAGHRMHHAGHSLPEWVSFFCHPFAIWHGVIGGYYDANGVALLVTFWILMIYGSLFAPFKSLPVIATLALCVTSPKFRRQKSVSPTLDCCTFQPIRNDKDQPTPNTPLPETYFAHALGVKSARVREVSHWMNRHSLWAGVPRHVVLSELRPPPKETRACPVGSLLLPSVDCPPSSLGTPFGRMDIAIADASSYAPNYPLFADDMPHVDLLQLRHMGFMVLEAVQFLVANLSSVFEKLSFAYNWSDPTVSMISWLIPLILSLEVWLALVLLSFIPPILLRFLFILMPIAGLLAMTEPEMLRRSGAAAALDNFAVSLLHWQPESQLCLRVCVNIWDILYKLDLISELTRQSRLEELCEPTLDTSPQADASPKPSPSSWTWLRANSGGLVASRSVTEGVGVHHVSAAVLARGKFGGLQRDGKMLSFRRAVLGLLWQPFRWQARVLLFWFIRLPDRREMEHRSIAASQFIGEDLAALLKTGEEPAPSMTQVRARLRTSYDHLCRPSVAWHVSSVTSSTSTSAPPENPARAFLRRSLTFAAAAGGVPPADQSSKWYQDARKTIGSAFSSFPWPVADTPSLKLLDNKVRKAQVAASSHCNLSLHHRASSVPRSAAKGSQLKHRPRSVSVRPKSTEWLRPEDTSGFATTTNSPSETLDRWLRLEWMNPLAKEL